MVLRAIHQYFICQNFSVMSHDVHVTSKFAVTKVYKLKVVVHGYFCKAFQDVTTLQKQNNSMLCVFKAHTKWWCCDKGGQCENTK